MAHPWEKSRPISAWLPGGLSREKKGHVSRNLRPILNNEKCTKCSLCWIYCPEGCITRGDKFILDYQDCRGCGVCAAECPKDAIQMVREGKV